MIPGPGGLPVQVGDVREELAVRELEDDLLTDEVGPGSGGLADEDRVGLAVDGGRGVLRGRVGQSADDDEQRARAVDLAAGDQVVQQGWARNVLPPPFQRRSMTSQHRGHRRFAAGAVGRAHRQRGLAWVVGDVQGVQQRGESEEERGHERDLLIVVPDDDGIERRGGFLDGEMPDLSTGDVGVRRYLNSRSLFSN
jgi:hypothetical protein